MSGIVYPVIFLPGITASELRDEYPVETERVWSLLRRNYERTRLHPDNPRYEAQEPAWDVPDDLQDTECREMLTDPKIGRF